MDWARFNPIKQASAAAELFGRKRNWGDIHFSEFLGRPTTDRRILESIVRPARAAEPDMTGTGLGVGGAYPTTGGYQYPSTVTGGGTTDGGTTDGGTTGGGTTSGPSEEDIRRQTEEAYAPIFSELDRQIGLLPEQKAGFEQQVGSLATSQTGEAGAGKEREMGALGESESGEQLRHKRSLRDLTTNAAQLLQAGGNMWGDSSAMQAVTGGVAKATGRQRGRLMENFNQAMGVISNKKADVERTFNTQKQKIETWRSNKLVDIANWMREAEQSIRGQKAEIQSNMRLEALQYAQQKISEIDRENRQYAQAMDTWKTQRAGELEDYARKLSMAGQYQSASNYGWNLPQLSGGQTTSQGTGAGSMQYGQSWFDEENPWGQS